MTVAPGAGAPAAADPRAARAHELMGAFADRTGLTSDRPPERYLWTDAFAVCNLLGLGRTDLALGLVEQVHRTLGRHRSDDARTGWLSGLDEEAGTAHPTGGGLRIGKRLPERRPDEPFDERLEWDREGQYFHYLTKWMHALDQVARRTRDATYNVWARELADAAHRAFVQPGARRMAWKMSVDLSRPAVPSMGHHDPLDGYVTWMQLEATAEKLRATDRGPRLAAAAADFAAMIPPDLATTDPLGLGGLLTDAWRVDQLTREGAMQGSALLDRLLADAFAGMSGYVRGGDLRLPATRRLAFRELGLAIGLEAVPLLRTSLASGPTLEGLATLVPMGRQIEAFWLHPDHRRTPTWLDHRNINEVMLATSLAPEGYLALR